MLTFKDTLPHAIRIEYSHESPHFGAGITFKWEPPIEALREEAVAAANRSDLIVAFLGLSPEIEGEEMPVHLEGFDGGDRSAIELPAAQLKLVDALAQTGKPLILVLMNGSALALGEAGEKASAILEAWYPGQSGGTAIADTLFGENNPSGRLPMTFYAHTGQLPPFDDYSMQGRTYRYFAGEPLYPFGFGLSYTSYSYSNGSLVSSGMSKRAIQLKPAFKSRMWELSMEMKRSRPISFQTGSPGRHCAGLPPFRKSISCQGRRVRFISQLTPDN